MRSRANRLMGGSRIYRFDQFTDADNTLLLEHANPAGSPWIPRTAATGPTIISNNRVMAPLVIGADLVSLNRSHRKNGSVSIDVIRTAALAGTSLGVILRASAQPGGNAAIIPRYVVGQYTSGAQWRIVRDNLTVLGSAVGAVLVQDQVYRLRLAVRGSVFLLFVDDVLIQRADSSYTVRRGFQFGMFLSNSNGLESGLRMDNWAQSR